MKKISTNLAIIASSTMFSQAFTTRTVALGSGMSANIYTDTYKIKLTLIGSSSYMALSFNASNMSSTADTFIFNNAATRDYQLSGGYSAPNSRCCSKLDGNIQYRNPPNEIFL